MTETHDVLGIRSKINFRALWMFPYQHFGYNMGIRYGGHTRKAIVLCFTTANLSAIIIDCSFSALQLGPERK